MDQRHCLLEHQLRQHFGESFIIPKEWRGFINAVKAIYLEAVAGDNAPGPSASGPTEKAPQIPMTNGRQRTAFRTVPDLMLRLDQNGEILDSKAGAAGDPLLQRQKFFEKGIRGISIKPVQEQFQEAVRRVLTENSLISIEYSLLLQGQEYFYEARLAPLEENQIVVIIRNITERKESEAAIQERLKLEEQLSKLAATAPGVIHAYRIRPDGTPCFPYANPSIETIYGCKPEDILLDATPAANCVHPDDVPRLKASVEKSASNMSLWREEFRVYHPQKGLIWVEGCSSPVREPDGSITWHGFLLDITERKQTQLKLEHSLSLLQSTFNSTADGILVVDNTGRMISFNERFASLWRMPQNILNSRNDDTALAYAKNQLKEPDTFLGKVRELYATPEAESFDVLEFKDGRIFERYSCPQRLDGKPIGRVWSFRDVTDRKRAEEELRGKTALLEAELNSSIDGILVVDNQGKKVLQNQRTIDLWKIPQAIVDENDDQKQVQFVMNQTKDPEKFVEKVTYLYSHPDEISRDEIELKDGTILDRYSSPVIGKDGKRYGRIWSFHDVTERKKMEIQLRQSQKMQAFGQLAAGVAHDFNNILTVIQGNVSLLQMGQLTPAEQTAANNEIFRAAERAANLTRQLLTFSRRQPMQARDLDLNEVVATVTKMLQRLIGEDIALETHYAPGGAPVHADPGMMEQILMNLAVNARDAMPKGGRLIIETAPFYLADTTQFTKHTARSGDFIRLSIADTGGGIAPEYLSHLFEPFFTTKEVGKGTGLGLATVFGIVEQHRGWIDVESQLNQGTTFHIHFPRLAVKTPNAERPPVSPPNVSGGTETILLVEDEAALRQLMQRVLEHHGYRIHAAVSGVQALELWREHRGDIDILITDMVMPEGMTGRELADQLRGEKTNLKVIYCSGYANNMPGKDSPLRENEDFLEKPFEPIKLLQKIRACADLDTQVPA